MVDNPKLKKVRENSRQSLRRRRRNRQHASICNKLRPRLQQFSNEKRSSLTVIEGSPTDHLALQDTGVELVELLRNASVPTMWVLDEQFSCRRASPTPTQMLKSLCGQALQLNSCLHSEKSMSLRASQMQSAQIAQEWLDILAVALNGLRNAYIMVSIAAEAEDEERSPQEKRFAWYTAFEKLLADLNAKGQDQGIKVIFVSDTNKTDRLLPISHQRVPDSWMRVCRISQPVARKRRTPQSKQRVFKAARRS